MASGEPRTRTVLAGPWRAGIAPSSSSSVRRSARSTPPALQWMRKMIDAHHAQARESGARIVHTCGFDSIPSDLGVLMLQEHMREQHDSHCHRIRLYVTKMRGGFSGGTVASALQTMDDVQADPSLRRVLGNPHGLDRRSPESDTDETSSPDLRTGWNREAEKPTDFAEKLVEGVRASRCSQVEDARQGRLVDRLAVAIRLVLAQPALRITDGLGGIRRSELYRKLPVATKRFCCREEPCFVLTLRDNNRNIAIRSKTSRQGQKPWAQYTREIIVCIQKEEDASIITDLPRHELDGVPKSLLFDELTSGNAKGRQNGWVQFRREFLQNPPQENRGRMNLAVTFNDETDFHPASNSKRRSCLGSGTLSRSGAN